ncbi:hypothetical protein DA2_2255 [Desulfovibrio sp. A2]|nr:hypothetical protein DA2_2255 [Desulfovibrio sp. A2]
MALADRKAVGNGSGTVCAVPARGVRAAPEYPEPRSGSTPPDATCMPPRHRGPGSGQVRRRCAVAHRTGSRYVESRGKGWGTESLRYGMRGAPVTGAHGPRGRHRRPRAFGRCRSGEAPDCAPGAPAGMKG